MSPRNSLLYLAKTWHMQHIIHNVASQEASSGEDHQHVMFINGGFDRLTRMRFLFIRCRYRVHHVYSKFHMPGNSSLLNLDDDVELNS